MRVDGFILRIDGAVWKRVLSVYRKIIARNMEGYLVSGLFIDN
jgi:hypothetical protein